jgi:hypothetical protein
MYQNARWNSEKYIEHVDTNKEKYINKNPDGARFSAPVQTGPEAHPASCKMDTRSFPGGNVRPGRDADPSPPSSGEVKNRVELYLYSP